MGLSGQAERVPAPSERPANASVESTRVRRRPAPRPRPISSLVVGRADDAAEREADAVARAVVSRLSAGVGPPGAATVERNPRAVRRSSAADEPLGGQPVSRAAATRIARAQGDPLAEPMRRAPRPRPISHGVVSPTDAAAEREADALTRAVVSAGIGRPDAPTLGRSPRVVRRSSAADDPLGGQPVSRAVATRIARAQGDPLAEPVRTTMESGFGAQLGDVRVHTGAGPAALAADLGARAFTTGRDIFFGAGAYAPATSEGQQLLAHELTHVLQQTPAVRRKRNAERARNEKVRTWSERLQRVVPGLTAVDAGTIADGFVDTAISIVEAEALAALIAAGWTPPNVITLGRRYKGQPGALTVAQWATVASAALLVNQVNHVVTFARLPGWTADPILALVRALAAGAGGRPAQAWLQLARHAAADDHNTVARFARIANGWTDNGVDDLLVRFTANPGGRHASVWVRLAGCHAAFTDQGAVVATIARLANGWAGNHVVTLAGMFGVNAGARSALAWTQIAAADARVANRPAVVAHLARIGNGWLDAGIVNLVVPFVTDAGGRTVQAWARIAGCHAAIAGHPNDVAAMARVHRDWNDDNVVRFATLFCVNAGARLATDWRDLAGAHDHLLDQETTVAALARAAWTAGEAGPFVGQLVGGVVDAAAVGTLLAIAGAATDARAMITAGWPADQTGTLVNRVLVTPLSAANTAAFLADPAVAAATRAMAAGGWLAAAVGTFAGGALVATATPAQVAALMGTALFPATARGLVANAWTDRTVGTFCGAALATNVTAADVQATIVQPGVAANLRAMTAAGRLSVPNQGTLSGQARLGGVPEAYHAQLLAVGTFPQSATRMIAAGWTAVQFGNFAVGAHSTGITAANLATLLADAHIAAATFPWIAAGFTDREVGEVAARASLAGSQADWIRLFMREPGATAACFALRAWGAGELGRTFGHVLSRAGFPTYAQLVQVFQICQPMVARGAPLNCTATAVRNVADGIRCGPPNWANVIADAPYFGVHWTGPVGRVAAQLASVTFAGGVPGHGAYQVRLRVMNSMREHVERRHTVNFAEMNIDLMLREGAGGSISFYNAGADIGARLTAAIGAPAVQGLADDAVWSGNERDDLAVERVAVSTTGAPPLAGGAAGPQYLVQITQFYPRAGGVPVIGRDLVAIGRLLGRI